MARTHAMAQVSFKYYVCSFLFSALGGAQLSYSRSFRATPAWCTQTLIAFTVTAIALHKTAISVRSNAQRCQQQRWRQWQPSVCSGSKHRQCHGSAATESGRSRIGRRGYVLSFRERWPGLGGRGAASGIGRRKSRQHHTHAAAIMGDGWGGSKYCAWGYTVRSRGHGLRSGNFQYRYETI